MPRPRADVRKAEVLENAAKPHFREINPEAFPQNALQVHAAPAHHPVLLRIGPRFHKSAQLLLLIRRKLRTATRRLDIEETVGALLIEAMDPVPQRLTIHAANAGRLLAIHPVVNRRYGKQSPRLVRVLHRSRHAAKLIRLKIFPNPDRRAHPRSPESIYPGRNESHRSPDSQESALPKAGITLPRFSRCRRAAWASLSGADRSIPPGRARRCGKS